jgi:hypothetical protein
MDLMEEPADREAFIKLANYPLIKHTGGAASHHTVRTHMSVYGLLLSE